VYSTDEQYRTDERLRTRIDLHARFSTNPYGWFRWVFDQINLPGNRGILELGCGTAALWNQNRERIPASWDLILSDRSEAIVQTARRQLAGLENRFLFALADAQAIPFENARFDAVIANHILYYVADKPRAFAEIRRVLKPGGQVYATTVGGNHMKELRELARLFDPRLQLGNDAESFTLENGLPQMAEAFSSVTLTRYGDALKVSEAEPLAAYVLSIADSGLECREAFPQFVEKHLASLGGTMQISKDSGMIRAWRP
jgi:SAM-dependent methyltransferase